MSPARSAARSASRPTRARARRRRWVWLAIAAALGVGLAIGISRIDVQKAIRELTLPLQHEDIIRQQAAEKKLDPAMIAAVIYAESRFRDQESHAGARGLMQITPATARVIEHLSGGTTFVTDDLSDPEINIATGRTTCGTSSTGMTAMRSPRWPHTTPAPETWINGVGRSCRCRTSPSLRRGHTSKRCSTNGRNTGTGTRTSWVSPARTAPTPQWGDSPLLSRMGKRPTVQNSVQARAGGLQCSPGLLAMLVGVARGIPRR